MDKKRIADVTNKLVELNEAITKLDSSIRLAAFEILAPLYFESDLPDKVDTGESGGKPDQALYRSRDQFVSSHEHPKPGDNVLLIAAWLYSEHGLFPITKEQLKEEASASGLVLPNRPDNTMRYAKEKRKNLFRSLEGGWQLTTAGELFMKEKFKVVKGKKPLPVKVAK